MPDIGFVYGPAVVIRARLAWQNAERDLEASSAAADGLRLQLSSAAETLAVREKSRNAIEKAARQRTNDYSKALQAHPGPDEIDDLRRLVEQFERLANTANEQVEQARAHVNTLTEAMLMAESKTASLQRVRDLAATALPETAEASSYFAWLRKNAPIVAGAFGPYPSTPVARDHLIARLTLAARRDLTRARLTAMGFDILDSLESGDREVFLLRHDHEAGEVTPAEALKLQNKLGSLNAEIGLQAVYANAVLFGSAPYTEVDDCIARVLNRSGVALGAPCLVAAQRLRLPIALAFVGRKKLADTRRPVRVAVLDTGFGPNSHGEQVHRVLSFALGSWQVPAPITVSIELVAPEPVSVSTAAGVVNGILLFKALKELEGLGARTDVVNVSLGMNEYYFDSRVDKGSWEGRSQGWRDFEHWVTLPRGAYVASAAGNDASCIPGFRAAWSSPINNWPNSPVQVVGQLDPQLAGVDSRSNGSPPEGSLATPAGTLPFRCVEPGRARRDAESVLTSFSTPYVAAIAALVSSLLKVGDGATVKQILRETSRSGVPDALQAVMCAASLSGHDPWQVLADLDDDGVISEHDVSVYREVRRWGFAELFGGHDLNGDGALADGARARLFGGDFGDTELIALAASAGRRPELPAVCLTH